MDHLAEAKRRTERAICVEGAPWAQASAQLAIAHGIIAWVERMDKKAADADDDVAYRAELLQGREALRGAMEIMP